MMEAPDIVGAMPGEIHLDCSSTSNEQNNEYLNPTALASAA